MDLKKQLGKTIAALLLFLALLLPTAIQFIHMFEGHQHLSHTEQSTNIHKSIAKCEVCSFHLAAFNYDIARYPDLLAPTIPLKSEVNFVCLQLHSLHISNTQLRAPPVFS